MSNAVYYCPVCATQRWFDYLTNTCEECGWPDLKEAARIEWSKRMKKEADEIRRDGPSTP